MSVSRERVIEALRAVFDPELGMSVVDLGLMYDIGIDSRRVRITMTLTSERCPMHDSMTDWVRRAVEQVPGVEEVAVILTFDPPWSPERMDAL